LIAVTIAAPIAGGACQIFQIRFAQQIIAWRDLAAGWLRAA